MVNNTDRSGGVGPPAWNPWIGKTMDLILPESASQGDFWKNGGPKNLLQTKQTRPPAPNRGRRGARPAVTESTEAQKSHDSPGDVKDQRAVQRLSCSKVIVTLCLLNIYTSAISGSPHSRSNHLSHRLAHQPADITSKFLYQSPAFLALSHLTISSGGSVYLSSPFDTPY